MTKKLLILGLVLSMVFLVGCQEKPDLSNPYVKYCYELDLTDFTYLCEWNKVILHTGKQSIDVSCEFLPIFYRQDIYGTEQRCRIQDTELGYNVFGGNKYRYDKTELNKLLNKHDGIFSPCLGFGHTLDENLKGCYDEIPEEFKDVKKETKEKIDDWDRNPFALKYSLGYDSSWKKNDN